jgi:cephalosporin-C deacetylase-like acetyl esterase
LFDFKAVLRSAKVPAIPERGKPQAMEEGVVMEETAYHGSGPGGRTVLWLNLPAGAHKAKSLPCVLVAPAGSTMFQGMKLSEGDRDEQVPYVKEGFACMGFSLDGDMSDMKGTIGDVQTTFQQFVDSGGGVVNLRNAIEFLLAKVPEVDPARLYLCGHSSSATFALYACTVEPRIKAVCAYSPACDPLAFQNHTLTFKFLEGKVDNVDTFLSQVAPLNYVDRIHVPTLLFYAENENPHLTGYCHQMAEELKPELQTFQLTTSNTRDHYKSMIEYGIPAGITFLKEKVHAFDAKPGK